jgi:N-acetylglucosamine-6-phosphate deacetylase
LLAIVNGEIITPRRLIGRGVLLIGEGRILAVGPAERVSIPSGAERLDAAGLRVLPGLIDRHLHGGGGGSGLPGGEEGLARMARFLAAHGVTAFLPTSSSAPLPELEEFLAAVQAAMGGVGEGARVLGAHLEGPYLNPEFKGAHEERFLRRPSIPECERLLSCFPGVVKLMTLAPELPGARELISFLVSRGVSVAIGHSSATFGEVEAAIAAGATSIAHTYNAMRPFHHREPGPVGAALARDDVYAEIIADFVHTHPAAIEILLRCKPADRVVLVSDSISAAGLPEGEHDFAGQKVTVEQGAVRLASGRLAGSILTLERAVANLVGLGRSPRLAVQMATANPAASLGLRRRGRLRRGAPADVALLDSEWRVRTTLVAGNVVYRG